MIEWKEMDEEERKVFEAMILSRIRDKDGIFIERSEWGKLAKLRKFADITFKIEKLNDKASVVRLELEQLIVKKDNIQQTIIENDDLLFKKFEKLRAIDQEILDLKTKRHRIAVFEKRLWQGTSFVFFLLFLAQLL